MHGFPCVLTLRNIAVCRVMALASGIGNREDDDHNHLSDATSQAVNAVRCRICNTRENAMKKCRRCTKPATLHVTEIREGKAAIVHLCDTCAREYLEQNPDDENPTIAADLASKLDELIGDSHSPASCPNCGISFSEFRESGRFGCSQDYTEFMTELLPLLENIHEDVEHKGKRPRSTLVGTQEQGQLIQLRNEQRNAIEEEDYETAARLRDEIAALENAMREETPKKPRRKKKAAPPE